MNYLVELLPTVTFLLVVYFLAQIFWKMTAISETRRWCDQHALTVSSDHPVVFRMGRPAHLQQVVIQGGNSYLCDFELHSGFTSMPKSIFEVWGEVRLISKVPL